MGFDKDKRGQPVTDTTGYQDVDLVPVTDLTGYTDVDVAEKKKVEPSVSPFSAGPFRPPSRLRKGIRNTPPPEPVTPGVFPPPPPPEQPMEAPLLPWQQRKPITIPVTPGVRPDQLPGQQPGPEEEPLLPWQQKTPIKMPPAVADFQPVPVTLNTYKESADFITRDLQLKQGLKGAPKTSPDKYSLLNVPLKLEADKVMTDPLSMRTYYQSGLADLDTQIDQLQSKADQVIISSAGTTPGFAAGSAQQLMTGGNLLSNPEYQHLSNQINTLKARRNTMTDAVKKTATMAIAKKFIDSKMPIDEVAVGKEFGYVTDPLYDENARAAASFKQTLDGAPSVDPNMPASASHQKEKVRQAEAATIPYQNIQHDLYQKGAQVMRDYFSIVSADKFDAALPKLKQINTLIAARDNATNIQEKAAIQRGITGLLKDDNVQEYLQATRTAFDYADKSENAADKFPQVKRQQLRQAINDTWMQIVDARNENKAGTLDMLPSYIFGEMATPADAKELSEKTGIPEDTVLSIINERNKGYIGRSAGGVIKTGIAQALARSSDEALAAMAMGTNRILGVDDVDAKNRLISDKQNIYQTEAEKLKLMDDYGNWNINPSSIINTGAKGTGQTAILAIPSTLTGGLAAEGTALAKGLEWATTIGAGYAMSYEDVYKEIGKYTNDEKLRRQVTALVTLENAVPEIVMSPTELIKRSGLSGAVKNLGKEAAYRELSTVAESGLKETAKKRLIAGAKALAEPLLAENYEELMTLYSSDITKKTMLGTQMDAYYTEHGIKPPGLTEQAFQTIVQTTLQTLPLATGAGISGSKDMSDIRKEAIFNAGMEADVYKLKAQQEFDAGTIDEATYNQRVKLINTMEGIVANVNALKKKNGKPFSYEDKRDLAAQQYRIEVNNSLQKKGNGTIAGEQQSIEEDTAVAQAIQNDILERPIDMENLPPGYLEEAHTSLIKTQAQLQQNIANDRAELEELQKDPVANANKIRTTQEDIADGESSLQRVSQRLDDVKSKMKGVTVTRPGQIVQPPVTTVSAVEEPKPAVTVTKPEEVSRPQVTTVGAGFNPAATPAVTVTRPGEVNQPAVTTVGAPADAAPAVTVEGEAKDQAAPQPAAQGATQGDFISDMEGNGFVLSDKGEYQRDGIGLSIKRGSTVAVNKNGDVIYTDSPNQNDIVLREIKVNDEAARGKGNATKVLDDFLKNADKHGYTVYIEPTPIKAVENKNNLTKEQLIKWYEKRGFEKKNDAIWVRKAGPAATQQQQPAEPTQQQQPVAPFVETPAQVAAVAPAGVAAGTRLTPGDQVSTRPLTEEEHKQSNKVGDAPKNKFQQANKWVSNKLVTIVTGNNERVTGRWALVPVESITASHDPNKGFASSEGYPTDEQGFNVNSTDYTKEDAQAPVTTIGANYNQAALDNPVVVTRDGIVVSGNNRTMSGQLAAKNNTREQYDEELQNRLGDETSPSLVAGATKADYAHVAQSGTPQLVFLTENVPEYSAEYYDRFNKSDMKLPNEVEEAIKLGRTLISDAGKALMRKVTDIIGEFKTMADFYRNRRKGGQDGPVGNVFGILSKRDATGRSVIPSTQVPQYYSNGKISVRGKQFLESLLLGTMLDRNTVGALNDEGMDDYRQNVVRNIQALSDLVGNKEYSLAPVIDKAISLLHDWEQSGDSQSFYNYLSQLGNEYNPNRTAESMIMALALQEKAGAFKDFINEYKRNADTAAAEAGGMSFEPTATQKEILEHATNIDNDRIQKINSLAAINQELQPGTAGEAQSGAAESAPKPAATEAAAAANAQPQTEAAGLKNVTPEQQQAINTVVNNIAANIADRLGIPKEDYLQSVRTVIVDNIPDTGTVMSNEEYNAVLQSLRSAFYDSENLDEFLSEEDGGPFTVQFQDGIPENLAAQGFTTWDAVYAAMARQKVGSANFQMAQFKRTLDANLAELKKNIQAGKYYTQDFSEGYLESQARLADAEGRTREANGLRDAKTNDELRAKMVEFHVNNMRETLESWVNYVTNPAAGYSPAYQYAVLTAVSTWIRSPVYAKGEDGKVQVTNGQPVITEYKTVKRSGKSTGGFPAVFSGAIAELFNTGAATMSNADILERIDALNEAEANSRKDVFKSDEKGEWIQFKGKEKNPAGYEEEANNLSAFSAPTPWCLKSANTARSYLESGDVFVYRTKDAEGNYKVPRIGVAINNDGSMRELRGIEAESQQLVEESMMEEAKAFITRDNPGISGGERWLGELERTAKTREFTKKVEEETWTKEEFDELLMDHSRIIKKNPDAFERRAKQLGLVPQDKSVQVIAPYSPDPKITGDYILGDIFYLEQTTAYRQVLDLSNKTIVGNVSLDDLAILNGATIIGNLRLNAGGPYDITGLKISGLITTKEDVKITDSTSEPSRSTLSSLYQGVYVEGNNEDKPLNAEFGLAPAGSIDAVKMMFNGTMGKVKISNKATINVNGRIDELDLRGADIQDMYIGRGSIGKILTDENTTWDGVPLAEKATKKYDSWKERDAVDWAKRLLEGGPYSNFLNDEVDVIGYEIGSSKGPFMLNAFREGYNISQEITEDNQLDNIVGKEMADKIRAGEGKPEIKYGKNLMMIELPHAAAKKQAKEEAKAAALANAKKEATARLDAIHEEAQAKIKATDAAEKALPPALKKQMFDLRNQYQRGQISFAVFTDRQNQILEQGAQQAAAPAEPRRSLMDRLMRRQDRRGAIISNQKKSVILMSREHADATTEIHEWTHEFEKVLTPEEKQTVMGWAGHSTWTGKTSEAFAKGAERYLYEGQTNNSKMKAIFEQFKSWLHDLFASDYFDDVKTLTPEMRKLYDTIMSDPQFKEAAPAPKPAAPTSGRQKQGSDFRKKKDIIPAIMELEPDQDVRTRVMEQLIRDKRVRDIVGRAAVTGANLTRRTHEELQHFYDALVTHQRQQQAKPAPHVKKGAEFKNKQDIIDALADEFDIMIYDFEGETRKDLNEIYDRNVAHREKEKAAAQPAAPAATAEDAALAEKFAATPPAEEPPAPAEPAKPKFTAEQEAFNKKVDDIKNKLLSKLSSDIPGVQKMGAGLDLASLLDKAADIIKEANRLRGNLGEAIGKAVDYMKANWDKAWGEFPEEDIGNAVVEMAGVKRPPEPEPEPQPKAAASSVTVIRPSQQGQGQGGQGNNTGTGNIPGLDDYDMKTGNEVGQMLSGKTWRDVFQEEPGNTDYKKTTLQLMLDDATSMINAAQKHFGSTDILDYGRKLYDHIRQMPNDNAAKKSALMATFLAELQKAKLDAQEANDPRAGQIQTLQDRMNTYFRTYMNDLGKGVVANRLLRLYRNEYMAEYYADKIMEENAAKEKRRIAKAVEKSNNSDIDEDIADSGGLMGGETITDEQKDASDEEDQADFNAAPPEPDAPKPPPAPGRAGRKAAKTQAKENVKNASADQSKAAAALAQKQAALRKKLGVKTDEEVAKFLNDEQEKTC